MEYVRMQNGCTITMWITSCIGYHMKSGCTEMAPNQLLQGMPKNDRAPELNVMHNTQILLRKKLHMNHYFYKSFSLITINRVNTFFISIYLQS
jgi:hypothetical protein